EGSPDAADAPWVLLKWALAASRVGRTDDVSAALDQLASRAGAREMRVGGRTMLGADVARQQRARLAPQAPPAAETNWRSCAGPHGDRQMTGQALDPLRQVWQIGLATPAGTLKSQRADTGPCGPVGPRTMGTALFSQISLPVTYNDRLFVQSASSVQCIQAADGQLLWTAKEPFEMNLPHAIGGRFTSYYYRSARAIQGAPVATRGRVYVRMPVGNMDGYGASRWPADYALAALDVRTGEPIWLRLAGSSDTR